MGDARPPILFVEDSADARELVEYSLRQDGFRVTTAQTGEDGITRARVTTQVSPTNAVNDGSRCG